MKKRVIIGIIVFAILCAVGVLVYILTHQPNEEVPNKTEPYPDIIENIMPEETTREEAEKLIKEELGNIDIEFKEETDDWYFFDVTTEGQGIKKIHFNKFTNEIVPIRTERSSGQAE